MGGRYYTRASKLVGLVEIAAERGADIDDLLRAAGLCPSVLRSPEAAIDYGAFCELLRRCAVAWDLPDIGLRMIRYQQIDFLGPVALVTRMERTVRDALRAIIANLVIHANATVAAFEEQAGSSTTSLVLNQRD
ncbi:MAG TPA: AraC family transcriptional regulator ligand-binding domain-containing protein, partial [Bradyrhizobium sp.]|nr:AraC family transcriptional regulator ligand-binding domain-containing protein [Bradyrhizobium sp.]